MECEDSKVTEGSIRPNTRTYMIHKKKMLKDLIKSAYSSDKDHLFTDFQRYNSDTNGLSLFLVSGRGDKLSSYFKHYIRNLLKVNMEARYGAEWPAEEKEKLREMSSHEALYIFVRDQASSIIGFVHYRFTIEEEIPVLYVYELQLESAYQGKGLGNYLMQLVELIARKNGMGAVVLTVQKKNTSAINFYLNKLRYKISSTSPSKVYQQMGVIGEEKSYEILCKTFDREAKAVFEVLEKLYKERWGLEDGVGSIILSPTRELANQLFDVLKSVGKHHGFSAGLLIGGNEYDEEIDRVNRMNILICTPGRLLKHMDTTPNFDCSQLQVLVLDEADRILDAGFKKEVNAIISQLPKHRQTLLFSAAQTKSVKDLARLSLKDPEYIAVDEEAIAATPTRLQQKVMLVPLNQKLDMIWSFIKAHLNSKILVFLSSCKQVRFVYEAFKKLRPGIPV